MKALRLLAPVVFLSFSTLALSHAPPPATAPTPAQNSFAQMKSLAGTWEGTLTTLPASRYQGKHIRVQLRVTSSGNALMHEMNMPGEPDDPVTMLYLNGNHLYLQHYCDAGNRPRMVAKISADGKTINFKLVDVSGSTRYGYMEHAKFTLLNAKHHTEDWTYLEPGNHPTRVHFDLHRNAVAAR
ncbi:MAG: hypothetical protein ACREFT_03485 [Acetobacteraceae bacterium]